jgi:hypothetical protein
MKRRFLLQLHPRRAPWCRTRRSRRAELWHVRALQSQQRLSHPSLHCRRASAVLVLVLVLAGQRRQRHRRERC